MSDVVERKCPRCKGVLGQYPATSVRDSKTKICALCANEEGIFDRYINSLPSGEHMTALKLKESKWLLGGHNG